MEEGGRAGGGSTSEAAIPGEKIGALRGGYPDLKARKHGGTLNNGCAREREREKTVNEGERERGEKDVGLFFLASLIPLPVNS